MAHDHYEVLEIPDNANDAYIRRAYDIKRKALAQDGSLSESHREAIRAAIEQAFQVLSDPAARDKYDQQRLAAATPVVVREVKTGFTAARAAIWGTLVLIVAGAGYVVWDHSRYEEKMRLEEEKAAAEVAARNQELAAREKASRESSSVIADTVQKAKAKQEAADLEAKRDAETESAKSAAAANRIP